ncbi:MAG TPA: hypothetical protein VES79_02300 [Solirubrobacteraceae bacterium]|nr:hypothetical protein [Solirubrobacteraceae bacterium]
MRRRAAPPPDSQRVWWRRLHVLLGVQSLLLVLASINRLWSATDVYVLPHQALRLVELLNLLVFPPASVVAFYLLLEHVLADVEPRRRLALRLAFVAAAYLFAAGYGMHEATNYLNARFCGGSGTGGALCEIVAYQDDELSHLLFFAGFAGIDVVLLLAQANAGVPALRAAGRDLALVLANAALVAAAIVANLGFEEIGLDLVLIALVAAISLVLLRRCGPRPLIVYFASAYVAGLVVTGAITLIS